MIFIRKDVPYWVRGYISDQSNPIMLHGEVCMTVYLSHTHDSSIATAFLGGFDAYNSMRCCKR